VLLLHYLGEKVNCRVVTEPKLHIIVAQCKTKEHSNSANSAKVEMSAKSDRGFESRFLD